MTAMPEVSVIMANYNGARFIADAIASVQRQTMTSWELIVVDDASTDASVPLSLALTETDPRITVLVQPNNMGPAAARNRALDHARGQWIAILDSDDIMAPRRLERLLTKAAEARTDIVADNQMICSHEMSPEAPFLTDAFAEQDRVGLAGFIRSGSLYSGRPDLGFLKPLIRMSLIRRAGARYDESLRIAEDFHFLLRLLRTGAQIAIEPETLYFYRKHAGSISHRMSPDVIAAMIGADRGLIAGDAGLPLDARRALEARIRGLQSWAVYEQVMRDLKAGQVARAAAAALSRPHAWLLLSRPVRARIGRALQSFRGPVGARLSLGGQV